jgi:circadian clock protein KaiB
MTPPSAPDLTQLIPKADDGAYLLRLYVAGASPRSARAIANLKAVCEEHLADNYRLEIIDLFQQPALAAAEQVVASPTLVKTLPLPLRRLVGDLTDKDRLLMVLGLDPEAHAA